MAFYMGVSFYVGDKFLCRGEFLGKTISMRGLFHAVGGPDLGVKYGIGNVLGTDNWDGWSMEGFFGPTASLIKNLATGTGQVISGDTGGIDKLSPVAFKRLIKLYRDDGKVLSAGGESVLEPTGLDKFWMTLGLSPTDLTKRRDRDRIVARAREVVQKRATRKYDSIVDSMQEGDLLAARREMVEFVEENPGVGMKDVAHRVAQRLEARTFERDPRRGATRASSKALRDVLPSFQSPESSEVARLLARQFAKQQLLGQALPPTQKQLTQAQQVDALLRASPRLTRVEARDLVTRPNIVDRF